MGISRPEEFDLNGVNQVASETSALKTAGLQRMFSTIGPCATKRQPEQSTLPTKLLSAEFHWLAGGFEHAGPQVA
jgi:hypothetical protein